MTTIKTETIHANVAELPAVISRLVEVQRNGGIACLIDMARTVEVETVRAGGVNVADLLISQPESVSQGEEIVGHLIKSGTIDLIVGHLIKSGTIDLIVILSA